MICMEMVVVEKVAVAEMVVSVGEEVIVVVIAAAEVMLMMIMLTNENKDEDARGVWRRGRADRIYEDMENFVL